MDLKSLYRQVIMDHYKNPRNKGLSQDEDLTTVFLNNPSCGDEIIIQIKEVDHKLVIVLHDGSGCSICCASASVMCEELKGKTITEANLKIDEFFKLVQGQGVNYEILDGDALAFGGVHDFPARIKCATLAWQAVKKGIKNNE